MKTFFERLIRHIEFIAHPSGGLQHHKGENSRKRKAQPTISIRNSVTPDCFAMRSPSKKQQQLRRTPAP